MATADGYELSTSATAYDDGICSESDDRSVRWTAWIEKATGWLGYS